MTTGRFERALVASRRRRERGTRVRVGGRVARVVNGDLGAAQLLPTGRHGVVRLGRELHAVVVDKANLLLVPARVKLRTHVSYLLEHTRNGARARARHSRFGVKFSLKTYLSLSHSLFESVIVVIIIVIIIIWGSALVHPN